MSTVSTAQAATHKVHTLASLTASQVAAIRRVPAHDQVVPPSIEARRPAAMFTDPGHFALEQQRVFRRLPLPVTVSALIAAPGTALALDGYGLPLIVARDRAGTVRAFLNACMHKGSKLLETCDPVHTNRLVCPYHAWSYALDGRLVGAARPETFKNLDKQARGLAEIPCSEAGGLIWAILDRAAPADFSGIDADLVRDFEALELATSYVHGRKSFDLKANWKLVLEPFLEGYHVQRLHASSVGPLFADAPTVVDRLGNSLRQVSGKAQFTPDSLLDPTENIHKTITHAYQVFPCTVVITSPYYVSVMILKPMAVDRTLVDYHMLTLNPADNERARALYDRSLAMVLNVFGNEDFRAAEICQVGLSSGALREVVYSGLEYAIPMHYETLDRCLGLTPPGA